MEKGARHDEKPITSFRRHWEEVITAEEADKDILTATNVDKAGTDGDAQRPQRKLPMRIGSRSEPRGSKGCTKEHETETRTARHRGLAGAARRPQNICLCPGRGWETRRDARWFASSLYIINVRGWTKHYPRAREAKAQMQEAILRVAASMGEVPILVAGDVQEYISKVENLFNRRVCRHRRVASAGVPASSRASSDFVASAGKVLLKETTLSMDWQVSSLCLPNSLRASHSRLRHSVRTLQRIVD